MEVHEKMKIVSVLGIRPDWIKMCSVISNLDRTGFPHILVHTGQHYSYDLDGIFFDQLQIRKPDFNLNVGSGSQGEQTARIIERSEKVMARERPDIVIVFGDSNSSLAALAASKMNIRVAHIESGMRAYDWRMPEEKNKRIVDHVSSFLFVYTEYQKQNLLQEGFKADKIYVVGNPTVDVIMRFWDEAKRNKIGTSLDLRRKDFFLATLHRAENVDDETSLRSILKALELVFREQGKRIILPLYPRTRRRIQEFGLEMPDGVEVLEPLGFLEFLHLEMNALCLITDSGTVQEEGCILGIPCVVVRISTERPETVAIGASIVAGTKPETVLKAVDLILHRPVDWSHPYGNGKAGERIAQVLKTYRPRSLIEEILEGALHDYRCRICFSPYLSG